MRMLLYNLRHMQFYMYAIMGKKNCRIENSNEIFGQEKNNSMEIQNLNETNPKNKVSSIRIFLTFIRMFRIFIEKRKKLINVHK